MKASEKAWATASSAPLTVSFEPRGAFYTFPCIKSTGLSSEEFCDRFLADQRVAVIPGSAFGPGGEGYVRACYAASMHDLGEALERLEKFLKSL